jgi:putative aldouronate transport system substrate-binding protein
VAPTIASEAAAAINWEIYPKEDPRHWVVSTPVEPRITYEGLEPITQNFVIWGQALPGSEAADSNVTTKFAAETMKLQFKAKWTANDMGDQWATAMAANDLPEFMNEIPSAQWAALVEADALADITDIWEQTATDLTKQMKGYPAQYKAAWDFCRVNGRLVGIPGFWGPLESGSDLLFVRQDWLKQVGLEMPKTVQDVGQVAKAFLDAKLGTVGLSIGARMDAWGGAAVVFGAYGYIPKQWRLKDGALFYSSTDPSNKEALAVLAQWYKDGLIEPDIAKRAGADPGVALNEIAIAGKAGIQPAPYWAGRSLQEMKGTDPAVDWAFTDVPTGPAGLRGFIGSTGAGMPSAFLKGTDPKKIEAVIEMMNYWYAIVDASRTYAIPSWYGYDYTVDDKGAYVPGEYNTNYVKPGGWEFTTVSSPVIEPTQARKLEELRKADPDGKTWNPLEARLLVDPIGGQTLRLQALQQISQHPEWGQVSEFIWQEPTSITDVMTSLATREDETYLRILTGKDPVDAWDQWVQDWKANGGDQATAEINALYAKLSTA